ncbi:MAG: hypothetical protein ACXV5H_11445 [Halobacteriota archaeon]
MISDCVTVDELLLEIADHKNEHQESAAEQLKRLCSQSYEAYSYLQHRLHDAWLPKHTRRQVRDVSLHIRIRFYAFREYVRKERSTNIRVMRTNVLLTDSGSTKVEPGDAHV